LDGSHRNKNLAVDHTEALAESYCAVSRKLQQLKEKINREFDDIKRDLFNAAATSYTPCFAFSQPLTETMSLQSGFSYNYNVAPHLYNFIQ
jgi:hypothetical protein